MDQRKIEAYRNTLLGEKKRLQNELAVVHKENEDVAGSRSAGVGADQNYQDHMADGATDLFDRERDLSLEQNLADLIAQVDEALLRIEKGTYGLCASCREPIDEERLKAVPYANFCLEDKKRQEGRH